MRSVDWFDARPKPRHIAKDRMIRSNPPKSSRRLLNPEPTFFIRRAALYKITTLLQ